MKKLLLAALLAGCSTASCASVTIYFDALISGRLYFPNPNLPPNQPPEIIPTYRDHFTLRANSWDDPFTIDHIAGGGTNCDQIWYGLPCIFAKRTGNELIFDAPSLGGVYQSLSIRMTFDEDVELNPDAIRSDNFVSGFYSSGYAHHNGSSTFDGPIIGMAIPEPASWAMMIGGFALAGGALRRRRAASLAPG